MDKPPTTQDPVSKIRGWCLICQVDRGWWEEKRNVLTCNVCGIEASRKDVGDWTEKYGRRASIDEA